MFHCDKSYKGGRNGIIFALNIMLPNTVDCTAMVDFLEQDHSTFFPIQRYGCSLFWWSTQLCISSSWGSFNNYVDQFWLHMGIKSTLHASPLVLWFPVISQKRETTMSFLQKKCTRIKYDKKEGTRRSQLYSYFTVFIASYHTFGPNRPFNLHPEKWFEGYPVKSTQIFIECHLSFYTDFFSRESWVSYL